MILIHPNRYFVAFSVQFNDFHWESGLTKKLTFTSMHANFNYRLRLRCVDLVDFIFMIHDIKFLAVEFIFPVEITLVSFQLD